MPKAPFRVSFQAGIGVYYKMDNNGNVVTSPTPQYYKSVLANWKDVQLQWNRHSTYLGVFRKQAPDGGVQFTNEAAAILRYVYYTQGSEGTCQMVIDQLRTSDLQYYNLGIWDVDFSTVKDHNTDFTCGLMEGGLSALLNAYDTSNYEIPIINNGADADSVQVIMDGLNILGDYTFIGTALGNTEVDATNNISQDNLIIPLAYTTEDGSLDMGEGGITVGASVGAGDLHENYIFKAANNFDGQFYVNFNFFYDIPLIGGSPGIIEIHALIFSNQNFSQTPEDVLIWSDPNGWLQPGNSRNVSTGDVYANMHLNVNDCVVLSIRPHLEFPNSNQGAKTIVAIADQGQFKIYFDFIYGKSVVSGYRHIQVLQKLTALLSTSSPNPPINANGIPMPVIYNAKSDYLSDDVITPEKLADGWDLQPYLTVFSCGDALRQLNTDTNGQPSWPVITTNFQDFHQDARTRLQMGLGIEKDSTNQDVMVMEPLSHFFQKDVLIADLGDKITDMEIAPYIDPLGNNLKNGYSDQTYDSVNGLYETNCEQDMQLPITRVQKDLNNLSAYRADPFGSEFIRMNLTNKTTTDATSDNDTFIYQISPTQNQDGTYNLFRPSNTQIYSGLSSQVVASELMFNLPLTPHRNLYRNAAYWKSNLWGLKNQRINFQTATKNANLICEMYADEVIESSAFNVGYQYGFPVNVPLLYKPFTLSFNAEVPLNLAALMSANPYGVFQLTYKGVKLRGFTLNAGINAGINNSFSFKLLLSPDSDL